MEKTCARIFNCDQRNDAFACRHCENWDRDDTEPKKLCGENGVRTWPGNTCEAFAN